MSDDADTQSIKPGWLGTARETGAQFFQNFIVGYNSDRREATVATARDWLIRGGWVVVGVLAVIAGLLFRSGRPRQRTRRATKTWATGYDWFDRLTRLLIDRGYPIPAGATPWEHAHTASNQMAGRPETDSLAEIPTAITRAFYQARYGGQNPTDAELAQVHRDLDRLQSGLPIPIASDTRNQTS